MTLRSCAIELDVALQDDAIGQERDAVRAQAQLGVRIDELGGHQDGDAELDQRTDHAIQRLAKVLAERRRERELEAHQRVDHDARRADLLHRRRDLLHRLVDGEIERAQVQHRQLAFCRPAAAARRAGRGRQVLVGTLLEHGDHAALAVRDPFANELRRQDRLAGSGRSDDHHRVARPECRRRASRRAPAIPVARRTRDRRSRRCGRSGFGRRG